MGIFNHHHQLSPEIKLEIKKAELQLENLVNIYRFFLFTFIWVSDLVISKIAGYFSWHYLVFGIPGTILVYLAFYKIHRVTKAAKPKPHLKYFTILGDYIFITLLILEILDKYNPQKTLPQSQAMMLFAMMFLVVNMFSALRIQRHVIFYSTALGIMIDLIINLKTGSSSLTIAFSILFILISGSFSQFISRFIYNFFAGNHRLKEALTKLTEANEEIKTANDELESKNDFLATQRDQILEQKKQITSSIEYASRIQQAVLGNAEEFGEVVPDNFVIFKPKDIVSGDFYWAKNVEVFTKNYRVFTAADCTGHGVPGAFMSMLGISFLNEIILEFYTELNAGDILTRLRQEVKKHLHQEKGGSISLKDGMDMALVAVDYEDMKIQFAGANNPLFIIRNINGKLGDQIEEIKPDKMPIGVHLKENDSFTNHVLNFNKGDLLYVFSDGIIDQFGGDTGDKFKKRRFRELLLAIKHLPLSDQKERIDSALKSWMGNRYKQLDDITVIGVRL